MQIEINNLTKYKIDKKLFTGLAKKVIKGENKEINLSVAFIGKKDIKKVNKKYRNKNKVTDVLSFGEIKTKKVFDSQVFEILICLDVVKENAKKFKNNFLDEIKKVFIHGILHILGYNHEISKKQELIMQVKEDKYISK